MRLWDHHRQPTLRLPWGELCCGWHPITCSPSFTRGHSSWGQAIPLLPCLCSQFYSLCIKAQTEKETEQGEVLWANTSHTVLQVYWEGGTHRPLALTPGLAEASRCPWAPISTTAHPWSSTQHHTRTRTLRLCIKRSQTINNSCPACCLHT